MATRINKSGWKCGGGPSGSSDIQNDRRIQFTEWKPDQPSIGDNLQDAKNVIPVLAGYAPLPTASNYSNAASENLNTVFVVSSKYCGASE